MDSDQTAIPLKYIILYHPSMTDKIRSSLLNSESKKSFEEITKDFVIVNRPDILKMNDERLESVKKGIKSDSCLPPIKVKPYNGKITDGNLHYEIVDGRHRVVASILFDMTHIRTHVLVGTNVCESPKKIHETSTEQKKDEKKIPWRPKRKRA